MKPSSGRPLLLLLAILLALMPGAVGATDPNTDGTASPAPTPALTKAMKSDRPVRVIVELQDQPLATYRGGIAGLAGLAPGRGGKLDFSSPAARAYGQYLAGKRAEFKQRLRQALPNARVAAEFEVVLNGASVQLQSGRDLAKLLRVPGIASVALEGVYRPDMNQSTLLINAPAGWAAVGGQAYAGLGVKVGVLDTGIDLDLGSEPHPCFDDTGYSAPAGFPRGDLRYTNNKVIVARVFQPAGSSFDASDQNGHGSHVAGTIACNMNTPAPLLAAGQYLTGVAPRAYLGNYNVFPGTTGSAYSTEIALAVESAVLDGMDVISMSLGGTPGDPALDILVKAVNAAVEAGVVVVVAAGNSGSGPFSVESPGVAKKVITAGASTNQHFFGVPVTVTSAGWTGPNPMGAATGDDGAAFSTTVGPAEIEDWATAFPSDPLACGSGYSGSTFAGKFVLIQRGACFFSTKVNNAGALGAIGVVIYNNTSGDPAAMSMAAPVTIPAVMISDVNGASLKSYIATNPAAAVRFDPNVSEFVTTNGDIIAAFSSRGPTVFQYQIKPDVTAPGVNVYSAYQDNNADGDPSGFAILQGTSMATPHVSGAAAILRQLHPDWEPDAVKSALTGTANRNVWTSASKTSTVSVLAKGGGRIDLGAATATKIVTRPNSISFGRNDVTTAAVDKEERVWVRDESGLGGTWTISVVPVATTAGLSITTDVSTITLAPGGVASFKVMADAAQGSAAGDSYGDIELANGTQTFHIPYWIRTAAPLLAGHPVTPVAIGSVVSGNTTTSTNLVANYGGRICVGTTCFSGTGAYLTGPELVYSVTVPKQSDLYVSVDSTETDVAVLIAAAVDENTVVAYADNEFAGATETAAIGDGTGLTGKGHTYYIIVDSSDAGGAFTMSVQAVAPYPIPKTPADQEVTRTLRPRFTWTRVPSAQSYTIEIATAPPIDDDGNFDPTTVVMQGVTTQPEFVPPSDLAPGTQYYWHVAATYAGTQGYWSNLAGRPTTTFYTRARP